MPSHSFPHPHHTSLIGRGLLACLTAGWLALPACAPGIASPDAGPGAGVDAGPEAAVDAGRGVSLTPEDRAAFAHAPMGQLTYGDTVFDLEDMNFVNPEDIEVFDNPALMFSWVLTDTAIEAVFLEMQDGAPTGQLAVLQMRDGVVSRNVRGTVEVSFTEETYVTQLSATGSAMEDGEPIALSLSAQLGAGNTRLDVDLEAETAELNGTLGARSLMQLTRLITRFPRVHTLVLQDVPGSLNDEANLEAGRRVRMAGLATHVTATSGIYSGGVDLFCAGHTRTVTPGAKLGVHSWSDGTTSADMLPASHPQHQAQVAYFTTMLGAEDGPAFYWFTIEAAPFDGIHVMTAAEIEQYKLETDPQE